MRELGSLNIMRMNTQDTWVEGEFVFLISIMICVWSFLEFVVGGVIYVLIIYIFLDVDKIQYPRSFLYELEALKNYF